MGDRYEFKYFRTELQEPGILWVTLDRPERRNAISFEMQRAIPEILEHFENGPAIREAREDPTHRDLATVEARIPACFESQDYLEGQRAFLQKRRPVFKGH